MKQILDDKILIVSNDLFIIKLWDKDLDTVSNVQWRFETKIMRTNSVSKFYQSCEIKIMRQDTENKYCSSYNKALR